MSKPFDATSKALIERCPADWAAFSGVVAETVEVVDADISTITAATDKVLRIRSADGDRIQHYDFQSGPDASVPRRTHWYNSLLEYRHELPVDSIVVLLHPRANLRVIQGLYERELPGEAEPYLRFRYRVIRVWELPVEIVFQAGLGVLPLAPMSDVRKNDLPAVIARMKRRLEAEPDRAIAADMWTATRIFLGLRFHNAFVAQLLHGVQTMKESSTYQAIVEEGRQEGLQEGLEQGLQQGRVREARHIIIRFGTKRFGGSPTAAQQTVIDAIVDVDRLEDLVERAASVASWAELLPSEKPTMLRRKKS